MKLEIPKLTIICREGDRQAVHLPSMSLIKLMKKAQDTKLTRKRRQSKANRPSECSRHQLNLMHQISVGLATLTGPIIVACQLSIDVRSAAARKTDANEG